MENLILTATTPEQERVKEYLEQNASEALAEKINNGVRIQKDGMTFINKKDLSGFMAYAYEEARKLAKGANCACISADTVFGWAVYYFEEDSIEGTLYNEDGTIRSVIKPSPPKPKKEKTAPVTKKEDKKPAPKPKNEKSALPSNQFSLFDMLV